ncbi:hypothetical protein ACGFNU_33300 [Spirillospora sp. NPDC048911]|uniref:hypothetical protein n=1 Tax=Spirillospora sp. NPDC048911 TaxID=3364527 RepID=UPI0037114F27
MVGTLTARGLQRGPYSCSSRATRVRITEAITRLESSQQVLDTMLTAALRPERHDRDRPAESI